MPKFQKMGGIKMEEVRTVYDWESAKAMIIATGHPVGVLAIGADDKARNKFVYSTLESSLGMACVTSVSCSAERLKDAMRESQTICINLTTEDSSNHSKRHEAVSMLKKAGIKNVFGVYIRVTNSDFPETQLAIDLLEADPPTADGLNGLVILTEK